MRFVRVWLPVSIMAVGVIAIVATGGSESGWEGGVAIIAAGMSVWLLNVIFRVGVQGERDRDAEDEARAYYTEHGYWPDEAPAEAPAPVDPGDPHSPGPNRPAGQHRHPTGHGDSPARRPPRRP